MWLATWSGVRQTPGASGASLLKLGLSLFWTSKTLWPAVSELCYVCACSAIPCLWARPNCQCQCYNLKHRNVNDGQHIVKSEIHASSPHLDLGRSFDGASLASLVLAAYTPGSCCKGTWLNEVSGLWQLDLLANTTNIAKGVSRTRSHWAQAAPTCCASKLN